MFISSSLFLLSFLPITLFIYFVCFRKVGIKTKNFLLFTLSVSFLIIIDFYLALLISIMLIANYIMARFLAKNKNKILLITGISINILTIGLYYVLPEILKNLIPGLNLFFSPIPIIYFIFVLHSISLLLNAYRKQIEFKTSFFKNSLYLIFFPILTAGPVLNYDNFMSQAIKRDFEFNYLARGLKEFIIGLAKILVVANTLSYVTSTALKVTPNTTTIFSYFAVFCFIGQVFYELSGISQMALGLARMFGFKFNKNFNYPLASTSFSSFIKKFNISIHTFVTDTLTCKIQNKQLNSFLTIIFSSLIFSFFFGFNLNTLMFFLILSACLFFEHYLLEYFLTTNKIINAIIKSIAFYPILIILFTFIATPDLNSAFSFLNHLISPNNHLFNFTSGAMFVREYFIIYIVAIVGILPLFKNVTKRFSSMKFSIYLYPIAYIIVFFICLLQFSDGIYLPFFM